MTGITGRDETARPYPERQDAFPDTHECEGWTGEVACLKVSLDTASNKWPGRQPHRLPPRGSADYARLTCPIADPGGRVCVPLRSWPDSDQ